MKQTQFMLLVHEVRRMDFMDWKIVGLFDSYQEAKLRRELSYPEEEYKIIETKSILEEPQREP